jgi:hypothetical protein
MPKIAAFHAGIPGLPVRPADDRTRPAHPARLFRHPKGDAPFRRFI